jgi:serine/threonine protein kinase
MSANEDALLPPPGTVIDGKYRIEEALGQGGMGVVVRALHLRLGSPVALKFLRPHVVRDPVAVTRFTREALAAARLTSEHVARVYDIGTLPDGVPFMVLEYLEGETLADALERTGPMAPSDVCGHMLQLCDALAEAHAKGIVHRDLKLANLFLVPRPNGKTLLKVLDFGISKLMTDGGIPLDDLTATRVVLGTPTYMAPEQFEGSRAVDARSDLWSVGVCMYRLLTGLPPFDAETLPNLVVKVLTQDAPSVLTQRSDVPAGLAAVVKRCLEREPTARYAGAAELAEALAPHAMSTTGPVAPVRAPGLRIPTPFAATVALGFAPAPPPMTARLERPAQDPPTHLVFAQTPSAAAPASKGRMGLVIVAALLVAGGVGLAGLAHRQHAVSARETRAPEEHAAPTASTIAQEPSPAASSIETAKPPPTSASVIPSAQPAAGKRGVQRRPAASAPAPTDAVPDER